VHQGTVEKMPRLPCLIDQDMRTEFSLQGHVCQAAWRFVSIMTSTRPCAGQGTLTQHRVRPCADSFLHLDNRVWRKKIFIFINSTLLFSFYPILVWTICHVSMDKLLFSFYPILVWAICHVSMDISRDIMSASLDSTVVSMTQHLHRAMVKSSQ
jgi:hypothetical protein